MIEIEPAYAKLNPVLRVIGTENGLHRLDTVILPIEFGDTVTVRALSDGKVRVRFAGGKQIPGDTATLTAKILTARYGLPGVDVSIEKRIPIGAGLGGSSADAAAVARAMRRLFGLDELDGTFFSEIGSDAYAQYLARPVRLIGIGGRAEPIERFPRFYVAILAGGAPSLTKEVFRRYDTEGGADGDVGGYLNEVAAGGAGTPFNALERAAKVKDAALKRRILSDAGFEAVGMTGSGSAYAGYSRTPIAEDERKAMERRAAETGLRLVLTTTIKGFGL